MQPLPSTFPAMRAVARCGVRTGLLAWFACGALLGHEARGQAQAAPPASAAAPAPGAKPVPLPATPPPRNLPNRFAGRAGRYYKLVWGIDSLNVKRVESGEMIRFTWRVLDPALAKALNDKDAVPSLEDPQAGVSLVVPALENLGMMRQTQAPVAGRSYWMAFSNKGRLVKPGDRVNVVVGQFRADGLVVD